LHRFGLGLVKRIFTLVQSDLTHIRMLHVSPQYRQAVGAGQLGGPARAGAGRGDSESGSDIRPDMATEWPIGQVGLRVRPPSTVRPPRLPCKLPASVPAAAA
jgi:hypothetical protein